MVKMLVKFLCYRHSCVTDTIIDVLRESIFILNFTCLMIAVVCILAIYSVINRHRRYGETHLDLLDEGIFSNVRLVFTENLNAGC